MSKKHYILMLLLLTIAISAMSTASAADVISDTLATEEISNDLSSADEMLNDSSSADAHYSYSAAIPEDVSEEDSSTDAMPANEASSNEKLLAKSEEPSLNEYESDKLSSTVLSPKYDEYTVKLYDSEISLSEGGKINIHISPLVKKNYYSYDFSLAVFESYSISNGKYNFYSHHFIKQFTRENRNASKNYTYTFTPADFSPKAGIGNYVLVAINTADNTVMDLKTLKVFSNDLIQTNDFTGTYGSTHMSVRILDKNSSQPVSGAKVKAVFRNSKKTLTKTYTSNSNGYVKFIPPLAVGTWTAQFSLDNNLYKADTVKRTVKINKASVKIKAYKVTEYQGFKITLKVKVTANGKKVNEGTVKFRINGKTYKATVKKGLASKKLKLKKVKSYKYTAAFSSKNFKTKKASSKAIIRKRLATKIVIKDQTVYSDQTKFVTVKVRTANGKKVKDGYIKVAGDSNKVAVKNGKAKLVKYGVGIKHLKKIKGTTEYYKKYVTKKVKLTYVPASHKYKSSKKTVKVKSKFRCPCGKTSTHKHYWKGYYYWHTTRIVIS